MKSWRIGSLGALVLATSVATATAATDVCAALQTRLAILDRTTSGSAFTSLDDDVLRQRQELDRGMVAARRTGCIDLFSQRRSRSSKCASLLGLIDRMKANLNRLTVERRRKSPDPFTADRERTGILRQIAMNQCGGQFTAYGFATPRRQGLFASLFGPRPIRGFGSSGPYYLDLTNYGTYRTLCVRTCDGYYFPISFSTTASKFATDEQACQSLCPGTPVALYTYRNPGEESDAMVSLAGEPYTALPTAFRYRLQFDAACTCQWASANMTRLPSAMPDIIDPATAAAAPLPTLRPSGDDPETAANRSGGFVPRPIGDGSPGSMAGDPVGKAVRVVGPSYYVAQ